MGKTREPYWILNFEWWPDREQMGGLFVQL